MESLQQAYLALNEVEQRKFQQWLSNGPGTGGPGMAAALDEVQLKQTLIPLIHTAWCVRGRILSTYMPWRRLLLLFGRRRC